MGDEKRGILFAFLSALLLSLSFIFFTILLEDLSISKIMFYWFFIAFIFALFLGIKKRKQAYKEIKNNFNPLLILGLSEGVGVVFLLLSLKSLGPSLTAFLVQFVFIFVLLYSIIYLKEKFNLLGIIGIILAIIGVLIINWNQEIFIIKGTFLALIAAFLFATSAFIAKKYIKRVSPKTINLTRLFSISLLGFVYLFFQNEDFIISLNNVGLIIIGSFLCAYLGFELFYNSLKSLKLGTANIIRAFNPLFTLILAFIIFSKVPSTIQIMGGFLILAGILVLIKNEK